MTHSIQEHQWVYLADLALTVSGRESDVELRRGEYCLGCSTLRVQFPSGWYVLTGDATKEYLSRFDREAPGTVVPFPKDLRIKAPALAKNRLGKGLAELMSESAPPAIPGLLKK
jgi:hypothetical protein